MILYHGIYISIYHGNTMFHDNMMAYVPGKIIYGYGNDYHGVYKNTIVFAADIINVSW